MNEPAKKKKVFDGRYEILGIVGRGRKSVVYRAKNIVDGGSEVALKVLISDPKDVTTTRDKLRKEALAMVSSHHKYVVRLDDFHSVGDLSYLSMEFAPESDLKKFTDKRGGRLDQEIAKRFLTQAAKALDYIHSVGIIHRDIKPDNILVVNDQEIRIADFGLALLPGDAQSPDEYQNAVGTMDYMAPELLEGRPCSIRSDLYALGITFIELVTGKQLFHAVPLSKQDESRRNIEKTENIPESLREVLLALVKYEPTDRPKNAKELIAAISDPSTLKKPEIALESEKKSSAPVSEKPKEGKIKEKIVTQKSFVDNNKETIKTVEEKPKKDNIDIVGQGSKSQRDYKPKEKTSEPMDIAETQVIQLVPEVSKKNKEEQPKTIEKLVKPGLSFRLLSRIFVGLAMFLLGLKVLSSLFVVQEPVKKQPQVIQSNLDLRTASLDGVIDLARLPSGRYQGELTGIHPALDSAPIYLISDLENGTLIVTVGIEGWKPKVLNTIGIELRSLTLSGGGILIELERLITNDGVRVLGATRNRSLNKTGTIFFEAVR